MPSLRGDVGVSDWWQNSKTVRLSLPINSWPSGGGDGGFYVLIRTVPKQSEADWVLRPHSFVSAPEVVHVKTGPAPSGAVLFGPFSLARKKKGVK